MKDPIILTKHLSHTYQSKHAGPLQKAALIDINLEIARGSCVAIIGVTGSGKSTLVQHFNGLLRPTSGTVIVNGIDVNARKIDRAALRQRVGMLFQFPEAQLFERTVYADVAFGPRRMKLGRREIRTRVINALDIVGLPHKEFAPRSPFELSGGQKRRAALAGVLAMSPSVLVLDEPTTHLDVMSRNIIGEALGSYNGTIIAVTHDLEFVRHLKPDTLLLMPEGRILPYEPKHDNLLERA